MTKLIQGNWYIAGLSIIPDLNYIICYDYTDSDKNIIASEYCFPPNFNLNKKGRFNFIKRPLTEEEIKKYINK